MFGNSDAQIVANERRDAAKRRTGHERFALSHIDNIIESIGWREMLDRFSEGDT
jgi:hypothetical protein